ncbi:haloacid dehalogenase [Periconia macrospinosa]|uniref:Haloacid dehalogenase n=1 Tax=Periconia macrospinosa TaxID=97972 RepID=A0A2V1DBI3_9PLEO|nr:haloacid dehalogenase [Periconia macrospinosa]
MAAQNKKEIVLAFDVYGTLLSTESIAQSLGEHIGQDKAASVAAEWRRLQLEYTWRCNSMETYEPFTSITLKSLRHALSLSSLHLPGETLQYLLSSYNSLTLFPDVSPLFTALDKSPHIHPVLFSNGTYDQIHTSLNSSPSLAPHAHLFRDIVVVGPTRKFKPHPSVYRLLCERVGKEGSEGEVWLVSGNPFDVLGARSFGMRACWVDRAGNGWVDCLGGEGLGPDVVVKGVGDVVGAVERFLEEKR